jgi:ligand-binding sensor domain-containing protein
MKKIIFSILILTLTVNSQIASNWQNYSDLKDIRDFIFTESGIWSASSGGAFEYNFSEKDFSTYGKAEGLIGNDLNAITIDTKNKIWFGSKSGMIDVLNLTTKKFSYISDILNSDKTNKGINYFFVKGDTIFVATDYGISLINSTNFFFYDSYFKLGTLPSNQKVNKVFYFSKVYGITDDGLAIQKQNATNLSAPESWDVFTNSAIGVTRVFDLALFNNEIIISTNRGLYRYLPSTQSWERFLNEFTNIPVNDIEVFQNKLFILSSNKIYQFSQNNLTTLYSSEIELRKISFSTSYDVAASSNRGILLVKDNSLLVPNGPTANQFANMSVDNNGNLWVATGKDGIGKGIMKFDGKTWSNFNRLNSPNLLTDDYYSVYSGNDGRTYVGSWGSGFARITNSIITRFDVANTPMVGVPIDTNFLVVTGLANDSRNNLWILNHWAGDGNPLALLTPDSSWHLFKVPAGQGRIINKLQNLVIDQYDTKWYISLDAQRLKGLFYFNENKTFNNTADDKSGLITETTGLNSTDISDIKVDKRGDIWVGSSRGVNIISNTSTIVNLANPQFRITSVFSLRQQSVKAIAVDPLNQKWIATTEGLLLVNSDGSRVLATLNSKNSPLLDDRIESLTIDEKTGRVYVGTFLGLNIFETPAIKPKDKFDGLFIYPNPFVIQDGAQLITIDGLVRDSEIKILSSSGNLVRKLETPGGRVAYWDGRDDDQNLVSSGIYLIIASDKDANNIEIGKVAVIRK